MCDVADLAYTFVTHCIPSSYAISRTSTGGGPEMLAAAARMLASKPFGLVRAASHPAQSPHFPQGSVFTATSFARLQQLARPITLSPRQLSHFCSCSHERYTSARSASSSAYRKYNSERPKWSQSSPCRGLFSRARKQEEEDRCVKRNRRMSD